MWSDIERFFIPVSFTQFFPVITYYKTVKWCCWWWKSGSPWGWNKKQKPFHGPTQSRLWCGEFYSGIHLPLGFRCPISIPPWQNPNFVFSKVKTKGNVESFCFILKLSLLELTVCWRSTWLLDPHGCVCSGAWENAQMNEVRAGRQVTEREREKQTEIIRAGRERERETEGFNFLSFQWGFW